MRNCKVCTNPKCDCLCGTCETARRGFQRSRLDIREGTVTLEPKELTAEQKPTGEWLLMWEGQCIVEVDTVAGTVTQGADADATFPLEAYVALGSTLVDFDHAIYKATDRSL